MGSQQRDREKEEDPEQKASRETGRRKKTLSRKLAERQGEG
jgi:hypothetical protein